jgi:hypothetical protein
MAIESAVLTVGNIAVPPPSTFPAVPEATPRSSVTNGRATRAAAAVLVTISAVLVSMRLAGIMIPHAIHIAWLLFAFVFVTVYPLFRLTRWIVGRWMPARRVRWVVWNWAWIICFLWTIIAPNLMMGHR